ncbi:hypothetical protein GDO78_003525 [Eleutherodactylus coqui]|uniref:Secreted protein n=1 Tax=Eleutherodactylus coqui TaxID=57060 RepID=A0A8J6JZ49_ELECQ|nr:hypothetical protein GDO78_003525 [Eleutherodactylus coqui]
MTTVAILFQSFRTFLLIMAVPQCKKSEVAAVKIVKPTNNSPTTCFEVIKLCSFPGLTGFALFFRYANGVVGSPKKLQNLTSSSKNTSISTQAREVSDKQSLQSKTWSYFWSTVF